MITLLSPSKGQDFKTPAPTPSCTTPFFIEQSQLLIKALLPYSVKNIQDLMAVSEKIADCNVRRFKDFTTPFNRDNSKQAIFSFTGDVYSTLDALVFSETELEFAQNHLRILSGLYGLLRPLDLMQAYRLEMKTKLPTDRGDNLYQFWGTQIQEQLKKSLEQHKHKTIINLASHEYFKALNPKKSLDILNINFKEVKNNKARIIAIFAKRARGLMANYIIQNGIDEPLKLQEFTREGYMFSQGDSDQNQLTFTRPQPEQKTG